tara:strand:- start:973 stop:1287 length:315 start_codon:yes stop_codon:yes gene_type:complete
MGNYKEKIETKIIIKLKRIEMTLVENYNNLIIPFVIVFYELLLIWKKKDKKDTKIFMIYIVLLQCIIYYIVLKLILMCKLLDITMKEINILLNTCSAEEYVFTY